MGQFSEVEPGHIRVRDYILVTRLETVAEARNKLRLLDRVHVLVQVVSRLVILHWVVIIESFPDEFLEILS